MDKCTPSLLPTSHYLLFCDIQEALLRSCVGLYTLTSSGQMEVYGDYIHYIPHICWENLFQKAVASLGFSGV